ncbi:RNase H domain-containing protein [Trichonephila clavipes]|nr:RNase H domain-containing protein [Trichonephila clavipes]
MERVIHRRLMNWLIENKKLHFYQTAFRTHHSTTDQLFYLSQSIIDGFQEKPHMKTLAVFLDISGAFDRSSQIIIGAVSSTNNEKVEQECGLSPLESRRKLATITFTNKLRSYGLDHISRRVFDKWKHSTRLKRSSTLQLDSEIRKELNLDHSSLEFLQEPLIPKTPPKKTCFELELLQPCSKKEDTVTLRQKGLETIAILSQDNSAIAYTDGSSDRSLSNGGAGITLLLPDGNNYKHKINTGIIVSNFTSELMAIREALILYQQDPHVIDSTEGLVIFSDSNSAIEAIRNGETNISCDIITLLEQLHNKRKSCILQWIPAHVNIEGHEDSPRQDKIICSMQTLPRSSTDARSHLGMPNRRNKVTKNGNGPSEGLFAGTPVSLNANRIAEAVIKTFDGI